MRCQVVILHAVTNRRRPVRSSAPNETYYGPGAVYGAAQMTEITSGMDGRLSCTGDYVVDAYNMKI